MTKIINESLWTLRRERAPLVWKIEKLETEPKIEPKTVIVSGRAREAQNTDSKSDPIFGRIAA